ncbi:MAG: hypothetical protein AAGA54_05650 [Myxococcota bacterium]
MRGSTLPTLGSIAAAALALLTLGCVDAPITADQLQADGSLRGGYAGGGMQQALAAEQGEVAQAVHVSAVLAPQAEGPLEDRAQFDASVGTVYLHVRADGLLASRRVTYRWRHGDFTAEVPGTLEASNAMSLGARFEILPEQTGHWEVEVIAEPSPGESRTAEPHVLFHREFVVGS